MTPTMTRAWETRQTDETRLVEVVLKRAGFDQVDAYRYNSASIRDSKGYRSKNAMRWSNPFWNNSPNERKPTS